MPWPCSRREVMTDEQAELALRVKCAETILDRVLGRPKESMLVTVEKAPWQELIAASIIPNEAQAPALPPPSDAADAADAAAGEVVEGEIVDDQAVEEPAAIEDDELEDIEWEGSGVRNRADLGR